MLVYQSVYLFIPLFIPIGMMIAEWYYTNYKLHSSNLAYLFILIWARLHHQHKNVSWSGYHVCKDGLGCVSLHCGTGLWFWCSLHRQCHCFEPQCFGTYLPACLLQDRWPQFIHYLSIRFAACWKQAIYDLTASQPSQTCAMVKLRFFIAHVGYSHQSMNM